MRIADDVHNKEVYATEKAIEAYGPESNPLPAEVKIFDELKPGIDILDAACGGGRTTFELIRRGFTNIQAFDNQPRMIERAKTYNQDFAKNFQVVDFKDVCDVYKGRTFDLILVSFNGIDYIETVEERKKSFENFKRLLKPTGEIIFSSHNRVCINRRYLRLFMRNFKRVILGNPFLVVEQSYGELNTYFASPWKIKRELSTLGLTCSFVANKSFLFPFRDPFPYYKARIKKYD